MLDPMDLMYPTIRACLDVLVPWNEAYRNGNPIVPDSVYDPVYDQLEKLVRKGTDSDLQEGELFLSTVGAAPSPASGWAKVRHSVKMGSLNKAQDATQVKDWLIGCGEFGNLVVSEKLDGISIGLTYKNGKLVRAATRGDGEVGEDITRNVLLMKGIVGFIKGFDGFIRGEIVMRRSDHKAHFPTMDNPRNGAAGVAKRQSDSSGCRHLTVLHYQMIRDGNKPISTKAIEFKALERIGCAVPNWYECRTLADIQAVYDEYVNGKRDSLDYDIDGLVVEVDSWRIREDLGERNHRPRGAVAYKFPHEAKPTILRNVRWQVGNTGRVTPVAEFDEVLLAGARVVQASLHNLSNMERLASKVGNQYLCEGDTIVVSRRNDVIPFVEKVVGKNTNNPKTLEPPVKCPSCSYHLAMDGEYLVCRGQDCPAQRSGAIKRWIKKVGVLGWGDTIIDALCDQGILIDPADLYALDEKDVADMEIGGRKIGGNAGPFLADLHAKKEMPLHVFVGSLGIHLCARSTCKTIMDAGFDTLDKMRAATLADIASIPGLGSSRAEEFVKGLVAKERLINKLLFLGVRISDVSMGAMTGKAICMTGFRDPSMTKAIEDQGGTIKSSVSRKLSILVAKDPNSTSGKAKKARSYGVEIIGIDEMWTRLGGRP